MTTDIAQTDISDILTELETAFYDIPFENSNFQNSMFVVAAQQTPARAYRAIGLRMFAKIRAIKELGFGRRLQEIDLAEKRSIINNTDTSEFDKLRAQVEIDKMIDANSWSDKLLNDALKELGCLYGEFKKLPSYSREKFEEEERLHFQLKLERQAAGQTGALESLANMNVDQTMLDQMVTNPLVLEELMGQVNADLSASDTKLLAEIANKIL